MKLPKIFRNPYIAVVASAFLILGGAYLALPKGHKSSGAISPSQVGMAFATGWNQTHQTTKIVRFFRCFTLDKKQYTCAYLVGNTSTRQEGCGVATLQEINGKPQATAFVSDSVNTCLFAATS